MQRSVQPWQELKALVKIMRILRRERPDVVHTHCSKAGALGRVAAALMGVPVLVHTYNGHVFNGHFGRLKSMACVWLERALNCISTAAIAISESQAHDLAEVYKVVSPEKMIVIPDGYDLARIANCKLGDAVRKEFGILPSQVLVVWAGRFAFIKNIDLLSEVILASASRLPQVRFLLAGDGPDRAKVEQLTAGCKNVTLTGMRCDMDAVWSASDIALLTSRSEGTPATMIEAMAAGVPFVSTEVGGVIDLTVPPRARDASAGLLWTANAFLTSPDTEAILNALELLVTNPDLRRRMGAAGKEFVFAHHTSTALVDELEMLYKRLYAGREYGRGWALQRNGGLS
jgi:glycosyltransferase involved in cell wall biosynthesis